MILLDTNVVSAIMKPTPIPAVVSWLNSEKTIDLFLSTVSIAEILYCIEISPDGKRRRALEGRFEQFVAHGFEWRILAFDRRAAEIYGELMAHRRAIGRPMSVLDGQIASIARAKGFAIATGNTRDFEACGLTLLNPFETVA